MLLIDAVKPPELFVSVAFSVAVLPGGSWKNMVLGDKLTTLCADAVKAPKPGNKQIAKKTLAMIFICFAPGASTYNTPVTQVVTTAQANGQTFVKSARSRNHELMTCTRGFLAASADTFT
jgi:hypothetical protein